MGNLIAQEWRPKGWKGLDDLFWGQYTSEQAFEMGADAIIRELKENGSKFANLGWFVFIPKVLPS